MSGHPWRAAGSGGLGTVLSGCGNRRTIRPTDHKNKTPIIPFEERIAIVRELKCVDLAVPQTSMNKMEAWEKYHFDALFHGSDWKGSNMYNKLIEEFSAVGVDVVFLPHTENVSSTLLSEVLHRLYCEGEH